MAPTPNAVSNSPYTIVNAYYGTDALPQSGATGAGVRVLDTIDGSPAVTAQQWYVQWDWEGAGYTIQNVDTSEYASSTQVSAPYYGYPTVQMSDTPDYWTISDGPTTGTVYITDASGAAWQAYTGDTNGAIILNTQSSDSTFQWLLGQLD